MGGRLEKAMQSWRRMAPAVILVLAAPVAFAAQDGPGLRRAPGEIDARVQAPAGAGTSGVAGIRTVVLTGNPAALGLYTLRLTAPPNTRIEAHSHRDTRSAVVVSGTWYFGYGQSFDAAALKMLPPGSFYTEPGGEAHFAETQGEPVTLFITGYGPTDTVYVNPANDPTRRP